MKMEIDKVDENPDGLSGSKRNAALRICISELSTRFACTRFAYTSGEDRGIKYNAA